MNFIDALKAVVASDGHKWAVPQGERHQGWAITVKEGCFMEVPSDRGGEPAVLPTPSYLFAEWDVVEPKDALRL